MTTDIRADQNHRDAEAPRDAEAHRGVGDQNGPRHRRSVQRTSIQHQDFRDLGFGSMVAEQTRTRLLNRDGTFNVQRHGIGFFGSRTVYHTCLAMSWPRFFSSILGVYLCINLSFGAAFYFAGRDALDGLTAQTELDRFVESFFFSVQTFATIGYGKLAPVSLPANLLVTAEALVGLLGLALATGLFFARFSRPNAKLLYSTSALIAPYRGGTAFEFRIANQRRNQLLHLMVTVILSRFEGEEQTGARRREFHQLSLERSEVTFFPLSWTIVHPITAESPLFGVTQQQLEESDAEFLIMIEGIDDTFSQQVFTCSSYKYYEVVWGARFGKIISDDSDGISICLRELSNIEPAELPALGRGDFLTHPAAPLEVAAPTESPLEPTAGLG